MERIYAISGMAGSRPGEATYLSVGCSLRTTEERLASVIGVGVRDAGVRCRLMTAFTKGGSTAILWVFWRQIVLMINELLTSEDKHHRSCIYGRDS